MLIANSRALAYLSLLSLTAATTLPTSRPGLRPIPSDADLAAATRDLHTKFAKDFEDQSPAGKRRLADILFRESIATPGDAALFATLTLARELASNAGEVEFAMTTVEDLTRQFNLDAASLHVATLQDCSKASLSPQNAVALTAAARSLTETLLANDDFDGACHAAKLADEAARKGGDSLLQTDIALLLAYCQDALKQSGDFKAALAKLQKDPDDPAANQRAGEFIATVKQEWGRALVMLSHGTDAVLKSAATDELSNANLIPAAGAWSAYADKHQGPVKSIAARHALSLYIRAAPTLTGPDLDKCLESAGKLIASLGPTTELADTKSARAALGDSRFLWAQSLHLSTLDFRTDAAKNKNSQALLKWKPKLDKTGELPEPPPAPGNDDPRKKRLTFILHSLVIDDRGTVAILETAGPLTLHSPDKPLPLTGPTNADLRRTNNNRVIPLAAHAEIYLDDIKISERYWKLPTPPKAWWLNESIIQHKQK